MADAEKVARLIAAEPGQVIAHLACCERFLLPGLTMDDVLQGCLCYLVELEGKALCAYALKIKPGLLWIAAGGQLPRAGNGATEIGLAAIEAQAREMGAVGFRTFRKGLVRKAMRIGYRQVARDGEGAFIMEKTLHDQHMQND